MKKYILIIAVILTAGISSCKKNYLDLEVNPNEPSVTTPQLTLAGALTFPPNIMVNDYIIYDIWSGYWSWNGGVVPPASIFQYQFTNSDFSGGIWNDLYYNATNFNNLINSTKADASLANFTAIGMVMKAWDFENLVDNFNDVPYSQAFQPSTILFPKYDKAQDIYTDLGKQLTAAIALMSSSATSPGSSDVMFGGDMSKWKQLANSLKLRLAVTAGATIPALAQGLPAAGADYLQTDALINPGYANTAAQINPFYGGFVLDANGNPGASAQVYRANAYSIQFLKTNGDDARLAAEFSVVQTPLAGTGDYRGNVFGDAINILGTQFTSGAGPAYSKGATQSSIFMLAAESELMQAEAIERSYITGSAGNLYTAGITADFAYLGIVDDANSTTVADYITAHPLGTSTNAIKNIITQEYIAFLNGYNSLQAYNNYRRTGYPALPSSVDPAAISSHLPYRLYYPESEQESNPDSYKAAGGETLNPFTSKIFWAQ